MRYVNGRLIKLGDYVRLYRGCRGVIVCDVDGDLYDDAYPRDEWQEILGHGVLILSDRIGLVHLPEVDEDLEFIHTQHKKSV